MGNKCQSSVSYLGLLEAITKTIAGPYYIHTYLCYSPVKSFYWIPFQWEFIPQKKDNKWITPTTLQYILFIKE
jgi:hypothetical protein